MFTGIIQQTGIVKYIEQSHLNAKICVHTTYPATQQAKIGDSIAVNGVCLTITDLSADFFIADVASTTMHKTNFLQLKEGIRLNLELALRLNDFIGGHLVQGHVNGCAMVKSIKKIDQDYELTLSIPTNLVKYCITEGAITLDGVSLTISALQGNQLMVNIIPHTWQHTTISSYHEGQLVNVEVDMFAKYIEKWLSPYHAKTTSEEL